MFRSKKSGWSSNSHQKKLRLESLEDRRLLSFTNTSAISIPTSGISALYPSNISVSELLGTITDIDVTLNGLTHTFPGDIDVLVVGPQGQKVILLSDVGNMAVSSASLTLDDAAANSLPGSGSINSGSYKPTNLGTGDSFALPAPGGPYASTLAEFNGTNPNGTWSLFVVDDTGGDSGSISGGWTLSITTTGGSCVIGDTVWSDLNSNGVQDTGESGVANWEIYLDSNVNGRWDAGEPKTLTDTSGKYTFNGLLPGTYTVAQVPRVSWTQTFPTTSNTYTITLASEETREDIDFGIRELSHQIFPIVATVDGKVQDSEPDGVFELLDTAGSIVEVGSYSSSPNGEFRGFFEFSLSELAEAGSILEASMSFYVRVKYGGTAIGFSVYGYAGDGAIALADVSAPSTFIGSFQVTSLGTLTVPLDRTFFESLRGMANYAGLILRMNDVAGARINIDSLEYVSSIKKPTLNVNALVVPKGDIQSTVWNDRDGNGLQDADESGAAGVTVDLFTSTDATVGNADDRLLKQTVTDAKGDYAFSGLSTAASYYLKFRAPAGFTFTVQDAGSDDTLDSDTDSSGVTPLFALTGGQTMKTLDAGLTGTSPAFGFGLLAGGTGRDEGRAVAVDGAGNAYVIGEFQGMADFDPGLGECLLASEGERDVFVAKYSTNGALVWARRIGGEGVETGVGIAATADGTVYATGGYSGTVDFDPGSGTFNLMNSGIFILKLSTEGNLVWARGISGTGLAESQSIAVGNDGSVYTTGNFTSSFDFDPGDGTYNLTSAGEEDIFIFKLNSAGNFAWVRQIGGGSHDMSRDIAIAGDGSIYTTGTFRDTVDFDPEAGTVNLTSAGGDDIFILKLNASGRFIWARRIGGTADENGAAVASGPDGNVYATGAFSGVIDFDPGLDEHFLTASGSAGFVSKLDSAGNFVWARSMAGSTNNTVSGIDIAADATGGVYTTGHFDAADFDPGPGTFNLTSAGAMDIFFSKLDAVGNFVWARRVGGTGDDRAFGIDAADNGCVYLACRIEGTIDSNPSPAVFPLTSAGDYDAYVAKFFPDHAPTALTLSENSVAENQSSGTAVGNFSTTDADPDEAFAYALVPGSGNIDNASFTIDSSGHLIVSALFDFESKSAYSIRVRTTDSGGMWYENTFTVTIVDVPEAFLINKNDWTDAGLTIKLGNDAKIHAYRTGTTTDVVLPHAVAKATSLQINGREDADDALTMDFSAGNPLPAGGLFFDGGSQITGDTLILKRSGGDDSATLTAMQVRFADTAAMNYSDVEFFGFELGEGLNSLTIDHATLNIHKDNAISAGTKVTVNGGILNFNGHANAIGNLAIINDGQVSAVSVNNTVTTVSLGSLTAVSIVCDTLIIGQRTVQWDGGGADNKWSTAANWFGDVAPSHGDRLVFPAGAARVENINDFPADTRFESITITGGNYRIQDHPLNAGIVDVQGNAVLTTGSIVCDTLTIGSPAPNVIASNEGKSNQIAHWLAMQSLLGEDSFDLPAGKHS